MEISNKFGSVFVQGFKDKLEQTYGAVKEAVPIVGQVEEFYAGSEERAQSRLLERGFTPEQIQAADVEKQQYTKTGEATSQFLDTVSDVTNIDRDLVGAGAAVLENLVEPGYGGAVAFKRGAAALEMRDVTRLQRSVASAADPAQNYYLTITDPKFIAPGVKPGIAQTPANIQAREMLDKSLGRLDKRRSELDSMLESGEVVKGSSKFARLDKKIREERYGEMSSFYNNLDQDPPAYRKKTDKNIDPTNEAVVLEQHHLAAKAQTQPFVEVMLEVGDPDDLVALHEYSRMLGVVMGNSRLNMLDAPGPIHRAALAKTQTEKLGNIHSAFSAAGMEPNNKFVRNLLKDAKTSDDVMRVFSQYAQEYLIPQQNIAKKIVKQYFEDYKVNLTASQKARFNELVSKANKGSN